MKKSIFNLLTVLVAVVFGLYASFALAADFDITTILTVLSSVKQPEVLAFALFAIAGVLVHVEIDIRKGVIKVVDGGNWFNTLFNYMIKQKFTSTLYMVFGAVAAGAAYFAVTPQPISWVQLLLAGATAGYTSDSLFNRAG